MSVAGDALRRDGILGITDIFTTQKIDEIVAHLCEYPVYNAHVAAKATEAPSSLEQALAERRWPAFCHDMRAIVTAPHFFEAAVGMRPLAWEYFGEEPVLYSMNAFWTQPAPGVPPYQDTHGWHRDGDDRKQLVLFTLGTDVSEAEGGAHRYQRGTHLISDHELGRHFASPPDDVIETIAGPRGTTWLTDTSGLHVGERPAAAPRLLLWARWGVSDPPESYGWDKLLPVPREALGERYPKDEGLRWAVHLVVG